MALPLAAQEPKPPAPPAPPAVQEQEPPEEDPDLKPKEYSFNPLEASRNITAGNFYFKKGNYRAASRRYLEASKWDPTSAEAVLRLGEADEKLHDFTGAREAYEKYRHDRPPTPRKSKPSRRRLADPAQKPHRQKMTDKIVVLTTCDSEEARRANWPVTWWSSAWPPA